MILSLWLFAQITFIMVICQPKLDIVNIYKQIWNGFEQYKISCTRNLFIDLRKPFVLSATYTIEKIIYYYLLHFGDGKISEVIMLFPIFLGIFRCVYVDIYIRRIYRNEFQEEENRKLSFSEKSIKAAKKWETLDAIEKMVN